MPGIFDPEVLKRMKNSQVWKRLQKGFRPAPCVGTGTQAEMPQQTMAHPTFYEAITEMRTILGVKTGPDLRKRNSGVPRAGIGRIDPRTGKRPISRIAPMSRSLRSH
jgi:hypothetical protein